MVNLLVIPRFRVRSPTRAPIWVSTEEIAYRSLSSTAPSIDNCAMPDSFYDDSFRAAIALDGVDDSIVADTCRPQWSEAPEQRMTGDSWVESACLKKPCGSVARRLRQVFQIVLGAACQYKLRQARALVSPLPTE
jgi:hypothetical protein